MNNSSLLFLVHETINGNKQALAELNDIFEENNLKRKNLNSYLIYDINKDELGIFLEENVDIQPLRRNIYMVFIENSEQLLDVMAIDYVSSINEWISTMNKFLTYCNNYSLTVPKRNSPIDWNFIIPESTENFYNNPEVKEIFKQICNNL